MTLRREIVEAAEAYFRSTVERQSLGELADKYRALDVLAVLLAWDAETATGRPRVPNETIAAACLEYPDAFTGLGIDLKEHRIIALKSSWHFQALFAPVADQLVAAQDETLAWDGQDRAAQVGEI